MPSTVFIVKNSKTQDAITENSTFNATVKVRETTKFPEEPLNIPVQFVVTVPASYEPQKSTMNLVYIALGTIVFLLSAVFIVLVWQKFEAKKKTETGGLPVFNVSSIVR